MKDSSRLEALIRSKRIGLFELVELIELPLRVETLRKLQ